MDLSLIDLEKAIKPVNRNNAMAREMLSELVKLTSESIVLSKTWKNDASFVANVHAPNIFNRGAVTGFVHKGDISMIGVGRNPLWAFKAENTWFRLEMADCDGEIVYKNTGDVSFSFLQLLLLLLLMMTMKMIFRIEF